MPQKKQVKQAEYITIYHQGNRVNFSGIGFCGPNEGLEVPGDEALLLIESNPEEWSKTPFNSEKKD